MELGNSHRSGNELTHLIDGYRLRSLDLDEPRIFELTAGEHEIGRSRTNDVALTYRGISRRHAVLRITTEGLEVEDQGSTYGTFVNGRRVDRAQVPVGAVLCLGPMRFEVESIDGEDATLAIELLPEEPGDRPPTEESQCQSTIWLRGGISELGPGPNAATGGGRARTGLAFPTAYRPGTCRRLTALYRQIQMHLQGSIPILIRGETGAGKEMIARILHRSSPRHLAPFVAINCSAIPAELIEAELFGIAKAVATGVKPRAGIFQRADGGTLLLDEIGDMQPALQAKLLRVLEQQEIQPVGGVPCQVNVRILAATNADLDKLMAAGRFRRDLYHRLAGDTLEVPPLRRCREDIPSLAEHFLEVSSQEIGSRPRGLSIKALRLLTDYSWPGNVRELQNEIRRLVCRSGTGRIIDSSLLSEPIRESASGKPVGDAPQPLVPENLKALALAPRVRAYEVELIREALGQTDGNQTQAAKLLGLSRNGLMKKMKRLGVTVRKLAASSQAAPSTPNSGR